jgi:putative ABC transport system ATP-binding protein
MPLIEIKNLGKIYQEEGSETCALKSVSFNINEGEFVAIMGPSGSGKSTLLHVLGFLDRPTSGTYHFAGKNMNEYTDNELAATRNKQMGFIFQAFNLLPRTTVYDNVQLPLMYSGVLEKEWDALTKKAIASVGLEHRALHESSQLSGGEKQRVAIARALVNDPYVIFADEPTGNLDSKSGGQVMDILQTLHNNGKTIILITHETYTAEYSERIIRLKDGELEFDKKVLARKDAKRQFVK